MTRNQPTMSEEELEEALENNPDLAAEGYDEEEPNETKESFAPPFLKEDWKHAIYMGLITGLLWAFTFGCEVGGIIALVRGLMNDSNSQIIGGILLLAAGVAVGVCAKLFQDKVKYGEV